MPEDLEVETMPVEDSEEQEQEQETCAVLTVSMALG